RRAGGRHVPRRRDGRACAHRARARRAPPGGVTRRTRPVLGGRPTTRSRRGDTMDAARRPHRRPCTTAALTALAVSATIGGAALALPATAAEQGTVETGRVADSAAGPIDYTVYLPPGYDDAEQEYPTLYLLHGRG